MSAEPMAWAKSVTTGDAGRKAVLLLLAEYADEEGSCYPGQKRIAAELEMGERTVRRHLAALEEQSLLHREVRQRPGGRGRTSDRYYLNFRPPEASGQSGRVAEDQPASSGRMVDDQPAKSCTTNRPTVAGHEQLENHQMKTGAALRPTSKEERAEQPVDSAPRAKRQTVKVGPEAKAVADRWWETWKASGEPVPTVPYIALARLLQQMLDAGWTQREVWHAIRGQRVVHKTMLEHRLPQVRREAAAPKAQPLPPGYFAGHTLQPGEFGYEEYARMVEEDRAAAAKVREEHPEWFGAAT